MGALIHSKLALIHTPRTFHAGQGGLPRSNPSLSDRMPRSETAHRSPFPPTASQVMTTDIAKGIVESKNLHILGVCSKWAGWALHVADGWWNNLSMVQRW